MRVKSIQFALTAVFLWAGFGLAFAQDRDAACCTELDARIGELEVATARKGGRKVTLYVAGIVTWPIMVWDDGEKLDAFIVSNEVRRPRWRFSGEAKIDPKWTAGFALEMGPNPSPRDPMDQHDFIASAEHFELRHAYWSIKNTDFGQVSLGLQSQATDFATETTLANTALVVSPGLPLMLGYVKRGWFMRRSDGVLTGLRFGDILFRGRSDVWGDGHRWNIARYDTPSLNGFTLSASWGEDDVKDAAIRYSGQFGSLKMAAAIGFAEWSDGAGQRGCAKLDSGKPDVRCWETGGSVAIMDTETGLFFNAAAGLAWDDNLGRLYSGVAGLDRGEDFYYLVAGIERQWLALGKTTVFGQYWHRDVGAGVHFDGQKIDATLLGALPFVSGADVTVFGASAVQTLAEGVDLYASLNRTETEVRTSATGGRAGSVKSRMDPFDFLLAGLSVRF